MNKLTILPFLLALSAVYAAPAPEEPCPNLSERQTACKNVHIIVARASNEAPGEGVLGSVASMVKSRVSGSDSEAVNYPAKADWTYFSSEANGTAAMTKLIKNYVDRCPSSKIVLMGYSQGAQVLLDTLCGTSEIISPATSPLPTKYGNRIFAGISMGDPSHVAGQPYNVGSGVHNGIFPRKNTQACSAYTSKIKSYCDNGDNICDSGNNKQVHLTYVSTYGKAAADFVVSKVS